VSVKKDKNNSNAKQIKEEKWMSMYMMLKSYIDSGNTFDQITKDLIYDGRYVRDWINNQRIVLSKPEYADHPHKILLDSIGFPWRTQKELYFEKMIQLITEWTKENNCSINEITNSVVYKGVDIGYYIESQRYWHKRDPAKYLPSRAKAFEDLGIAWDINAYRWEKGYECLKKFKSQYGTTIVPIGYKDEEGFELYNWVLNQRNDIKDLDSSEVRKNRSFSLVDWSYRKQKLEEIGFILDKKEYEWSVFIQEIEKHGFFPDPNYKSEITGYNLRNQIIAVRGLKRQGNLSKQKIDQLNNLGIEWDPLDAQWENGFSHALEYYRQNGHLYVLAAYICSDGYQLGKWLSHQRRYKRKGTISEERISKLNSLVFDWEPKLKNQTSYMEQAVFYYLSSIYPQTVNGCHEIEGVTELDIYVPELQLGVEYDGKGSHSKDRSTADLNKEAAVIFSNKVKSLIRIREKGAKSETNASTYYVERTNDLTENTIIISNIVNQILKAIDSDRFVKYQDGDVEKITKLYLTFFDYKWNRGFSHLKEYYLEHGNSNVPQRFVCRDGYNLGTWISCQRAKHRGDRGSIPLDYEQTRKLNSIGFVFDPKPNIKKLSFEEYYGPAKKYLLRPDKPTIFSCTESVQGMSLKNWFDRMRCAVREQRYTKQLSDRNKQLFIELLEINESNKKYHLQQRYAHSE